MNNSVELIGVYGSDEIIAGSAWTSTSRDITPDKRARIGKLIDMLYGEGHHTPFEKTCIHFLVNSDIASHIHKLKHRIGVSINAESARYKELKKDKYYIPTDWLEESEVSKKWASILKEKTEEMNLLYHQCISQLEPVIGRKRAKESARYFKTYNSQIECDIMFNVRSFAHFLSLRYSEHAQLEIRKIAQDMWELFKVLPQFKYTVEAIEEHTLNNLK